MLNLTLSILMLVFACTVVLIFARKGASHFVKARERILQGSDFYTELLLGVESAGRNVCSPHLLQRETRVALWEFYNNLRVQPKKEYKSIVLRRKMLEKKQLLFSDLEAARVNLEILPFLGILGTLLGFAVPYFFKIIQGEQVMFDATGIGFFFAGNIVALVALTYLKKKYEAEIMAKFDYYECQEKALEKIMVEEEGFQLLEVWLHTWPEETMADEKKIDEKKTSSKKNK